MKTVVWTDGSRNANGMQGRGGWAAPIEQAGTVREISGSAHGTTHNRMELTAICEALETLTGIVEVRTDSTYVEKCFNQNWHEAVVARWLLEGIERPGQEPRPLGAVVRFGMEGPQSRDVAVCRRYRFSSRLGVSSRRRPLINEAPVTIRWTPSRQRPRSDSR